MLTLLAHLYGKIADLRNRLYERGVLDSHHLGARTISIGNITTGGTGKTPLVAYVASILVDRGERVCILTRGYGRKDPKKRVLVADGERVLADATEGGDEPAELAQKLLGKAIVIADADRVGAAEWAIRKFGVTAFVLDDGFQHRRMRRDVDIVCIDATSPVGFGQAGSLRSGRVLPAGRLREPVANLGRADVIVITRADLVDDISDLRSQISDLAPKASVFESANEIINADELLGHRAYLFCGLGNPASFYEEVRRTGIEVVGSNTFADHHLYSQKDIARVESDARAAGADLLLTTAKDAVKLSALEFAMPYHVVHIEIVIEDGEAFGALI